MTISSAGYLAVALSTILSEAILVSKRCYKEAMSFEKAYEVMLESMGSHFDPKLKDVFLLSRESLEAYYSSI